MNEISIVALGLAFGVGTLIGMAVVYFSSGKTAERSHLQPTYYVLHPDDSYSVANPQPTLLPTCVAERGEGTR